MSTWVLNFYTHKAQKQVSKLNAEINCKISLRAGHPALYLPRHEQNDTFNIRSLLQAL